MNTVKNITTQQIIKFNALLRELNLGEDIKRDLIYQYTGRRSNRTNDMYFSEADAMIRCLEAKRPNKDLKKKQDMESAQRMRKKIFSMAHQLGWTNPATGKVDPERLNSFLRSRGKIRGPQIKTINDYSNKDLVHIVSQFQEMVTRHLNNFK